MNIKSLVPRIISTVNHAISDDTTSGIMTFGIGNNYPDTMENLILSSPTATAASTTLASFIYGEGFVDESIGEIKVCGNTTLNELLHKIANSFAFHNGVYLHTNKNILNEVTTVKLVPFKKCRLSIEDDYGYSAKVAVKKYWPSKNFQSYSSSDDPVKFYNNFSLDDRITIKEIEEAGGIELWRGQIYHKFADDFYSYPLSIYDSVANLLAVENEVSKYKLNETTQGFTNKTVFYVARQDDDNANKRQDEAIKKFMGADGDKCVVIGCDYDTTGQLNNTGFQVQPLQSNINPELFSEAFEKSVENSIRKCACNLPKVLIDYSGEGLGNSGAIIKTAAEFYNITTKKYRDMVTSILNDIFSKTTIKSLEGKDFSIKEKHIYDKFGENNQTL